MDNEQETTEPGSGGSKPWADMTPSEKAAARRENAARRQAEAAAAPSPASLPEVPGPSEVPVSTPETAAVSAASEADQGPGETDAPLDGAPATDVTPAETGVSPAETGEPPADSGEQSADKPSRRRLPAPVRWVGELLIYIVVALLVVALVRTFLIQNYVVPTGSMEQTLEGGDTILAWKPAAPERGEIVVFRDDYNWLGPAKPVPRWKELLGGLHVLPPQDEQYLVKRLIGLPGDHVVCCDAQGRMSVNGVPLEERDYLYQTSPGQTVAPSEFRFDIVVPAGHIFVMGDHRNNSADSRAHMCNGTNPTPDLAFPPIDAIQGRTFAIMSPPSRWRTFAIPDTFASIPDPGGAPPPGQSTWTCPLTRG